MNTQERIEKILIDERIAEYQEYWDEGRAELQWMKEKIEAMKGGEDE